MLLRSDEFILRTPCRAARRRPARPAPPHRVCPPPHHDLSHAAFGLACFSLFCSIRLLHSMRLPNLLVVLFPAMVAIALVGVVGGVGGGGGAVAAMTPQSIPAAEGTAVKTARGPTGRPGTRHGATRPRATSNPLKPSARTGCKTTTGFSDRCCSAQSRRGCPPTSVGVCATSC